LPNNNNNNNNDNNKSSNIQQTIVIPTTTNMDCLHHHQQQQTPILLSAPNLSISNLSTQNLSIASSEIPLVIANHLSSLTPTKMTGETPSLILTTTTTTTPNNNNGMNNNNNNNGSGKQKWFIQSGEHINGRTCLALSSKIEDKIKTDSQQVTPFHLSFGFKFPL
jgi:hypothetical protein